MNNILSANFIHELMESHNMQQLEIRTASDTDILTDDFDEDRMINYHIGPITKEWLKARIKYTKHTKKYQNQYENLIVDLLSSIDTMMLITLQHIIFVEKEEDIPIICSMMNIDEDEFPSIIDFDSNNILGCHWYQYSSIIINMKAIYNTVCEMQLESEKEVIYFNFDSEMQIGVLTTLTHEIRHLGLSNPFLDANQYPANQLTEKAVEQWGIEAYENWKYKKHNNT